jgi:hypothetical protein
MSPKYYTHNLAFPLESMEGAHIIYPMVMAMYDKEHNEALSRQIMVIEGNQPISQVIEYTEAFFCGMPCQCSGRITMFASGQLSKRVAKRVFNQVDNLLLRPDIRAEGICREFDDFAIKMYGGEHVETVRVFEITQPMLDELVGLYPPETPETQ